MSRVSVVISGYMFLYQKDGSTYMSLYEQDVSSYQGVWESI